MGQNRGGASGPEYYYDTLNVSGHVRAYDLGLRTLGIRNLGNCSRTKPKTTNPQIPKAFHGPKILTSPNALKPSSLYKPSNPSTKKPGHGSAPSWGGRNPARSTAHKNTLGSFRGFTVNTIVLETGLRQNSAGIPHTLLLRFEAMGFPTFGLLAQFPFIQGVQSLGFMAGFCSKLRWRF